MRTLHNLWASFTEPLQVLLKFIFIAALFLLAAFLNSYESF